jgi:hypothetical protein
MAHNALLYRGFRLFFLTITNYYRGLREHKRFNAIVKKVKFFDFPGINHGIYPFFKVLQNIVLPDKIIPQ